MRKSVVGARELKTRLGTYLRRVRQGARLVVTERGEPVAELRPLEAESGEDERAVERLRALVELTRQSRQPLRPFKPIRIRGTPLSRTLIEDREDRF